MRKITAVLVAAGFSLSLINGFVFSAPQDTLYVNMLEVFNQYNKTSDYDKKLEKEQKQEETLLRQKKDEITKLSGQIKLLKDSERSKKEKELSDKKNAFNQETRKALLDLKKERDVKMKEILGDINRVISDYAKKNKQQIILKKAAVAYADERLDKTDEIIKLLNKSYKAKK